MAYRVPRYGAARATLAALGLLAAVLVVHIWCLWDGTVLDDYWHQKGLREHGWSLNELMHTLEIEPAKFVHLWWQNVTVRWEYARPLFILCMKFCYVLIGGNDPMPLHAFSVLLHFASTVMVWRLAWRLTGHRVWSFLGGVLFAIYPHAVITVAWPSSQNVVLQNALGLGALLAYLNASRLVTWPPAWGKDRRQESASTDHPAEPMCRRWLAVMWVCWIAALLSRENALLLPGIFVAFELAFGGWQRIWARKWTFVALAAVGLLFVLWRVSVVTQGMPDVYIRRPAGDWAEYGPWLVAKLLHYLVTSVWLAPMTVGPTGRYNPWVSVPGDCWLMIATLAVIGGGYWLTTRHMRGWWIWPLWIVLAVLPVLPVIATPHSGYMSGVGFAVGLALAATFERTASPKLVRRLGGIAAIFFVISTGVLSMFSRWQWTGTIATERYVHAWVAASPPPRDVRDVFFINLPFINVYVKPGLVQRLGPWFEDVDVSVLAYAPDPVMVEQRSVVEQLDANRFSLEIEGQPYFGRLLGRFLLEGFGGREQFATGEVIHGKKFDVEIARADAEGVWKLLFTFPKPLTDPSYCFYATTPDVAAGRLRFLSGEALAALREMRRELPPADEQKPQMIDEATVRQAIRDLAAGRAAAAELLFEAARDDSSPLGSEAADALLLVGQPIARALAAPEQRLIDDGDLSPSDAVAMRAFWRARVDNAVVSAFWLKRHDFDAFIHAREELPHARMWARALVRSDLYLTGPPFDAPRLAGRREVYQPPEQRWDYRPR